MRDTETDPRQSGDSRRLSVKAAAQELGTTPDGIRARIRRGTLTGEKVAGEWVVLLPTSATDVTQVGRATVDQQSETAGGQSATVADLEAEIDRLRTDNAWLRDRFEAQEEASRELRVLLAHEQATVERLTPAITAESRAEPSGATFPPEPTPDTPPRSWWRRWFGL